MTINFSKIILDYRQKDKRILDYRKKFYKITWLKRNNFLILDYRQKFYKITWLKRNNFLTIDMLVDEFFTYFVVKLISLMVAFYVFQKEKYEYCNILTNNKTTENCYYIDILRTRLNCWITFTTILQFEERMLSSDHLFQYNCYIDLGLFAELL